MFRSRKELTFILFLSLLFIITTAFYCQKKLNRIRTENRLSNENALQLANKISELAKDIRIATYPSECDDLSKKVIGEECDLGNYMEWAGPALEENSQQLLLYLQASRQQNSSLP